MVSRSRTLRLISRTTSTSCGIGCRLAATFRRRCGGWTYRRTMVEPGRWGYPRSPIASPRWWSKEPWSRSWNHTSTTTLTGIDPANRRSMQLAWRGSVAGVTTWVLDLDIKSFFDEIDRELLMRAVRKHANCPWVLLYLDRWLRAPVQMADGSLISRERGTPQGGVVSPLLANLFLHYAFDRWMRRNHPDIPFERYADDAICHCRSGAQAQALRASLERRFAECGLTLHPEKTKIVYCKDGKRKATYPNVKFDFLGYCFRPRLSRRWRGTFGVVFTPAASDKALKTIRQTVRSWALHERSDKSLNDLARMFNSHIRGWINYYGRYYKSALYPTLRHIDRILARWAHRKFKSLRRHRRQTAHWIARVARRQPLLFAHWPLLQGRGWTMGAG